MTLRLLTPTLAHGIFVGQEQEVKFLKSLLFLGNTII